MAIACRISQMTGEIIQVEGFPLSGAAALFLDLKCTPEKLLRFLHPHLVPLLDRSRPQGRRKIRVSGREDRGIVGKQPFLQVQ
jgi:hypothetical protein